jgi:hypothetical protein
MITPDDWIDNPPPTTDYAWTQEGVQNLLAGCAVGRATLRYVVANVRTLTICRGAMHDEYQRRPDATAPWPDTWQAWCVYGETSRSGPNWEFIKIRLHSAASDFYTAWTLIHEVVHAQQGPFPDVSGPAFYDVRMARELPAHRAETEFLVQCPWLVTPENLGHEFELFTTQILQPTATGFTINDAALEARIRRIYVEPYLTAGTQSENPLYRERPERVYGPETIVSGWRWPGAD